MTHTENLIRRWRERADAADSLNDDGSHSPDVVALRARARLHREHANELGVALRRDAAELADEQTSAADWLTSDHVTQTLKRFRDEEESEDDRIERLADAKADHDFERKGEGR